MQKAISQLSLEKDYPCISVSQFERLKFCNVSFIRVKYCTDFQRYHICRFFSKIKRFQHFCVYKCFCLKKKDNGIIFFQWNLWYCFFSNLKPGRPSGDFPKLYFSLKFWLSFKKCWKNDKYVTSENRCRFSLLWKIHCKTWIFF